MVILCVCVWGGGGGGGRGGLVGLVRVRMHATFWDSCKGHALFLNQMPQYLCGINSHGFVENDK